MRPLVPAAALVLLTALSPSLDAHTTVSVNAGRGPLNTYVPDSYDGSPLPLIVMLHGYTSSGPGTEALLQLIPWVDTFEFLYVFPNGTVDPLGNRFWNATNACCNYFGSGVDDVGYLETLIDEIAAVRAVDPKRVFFVGHSNGGFMSYRMACDRPERVAAIASLAGAAWKNPNSCSPSEPVHVLQMHGTSDGTINYNGGSIFGAAYPGAVESTEQWAGFDGCVVSGVTLPGMLDLDTSVAGAETTVTVYDQSCDAGGSAELWTMNGVGHVPNLSPNFNPAVLDWLYRHPKNEAPINYCTAGTSASGCNAVLAASGVPSLSASSGFVVSAQDVEGDKDGLFFYGFNGAQANSWGNGTSLQCVVPPVIRTPLLSGGGVAGSCSGGFSRDFNAFWSGAPPGKVPVAGTRAWMQLWHRDPQNTSSQTTSLSDGLEVLVCP